MYTPETLYPRSPDEMTLLADPVKSLLNRLPDTWGEFDFESMSAIDQRSLQLLTAGGLVEQQHSIRVWVPDGRFGCTAICAATGWSGWDFAIEELYQELTKDLVPIVYEDWNRWKESPETTLFPVRNKIIPSAKWKLTDQGEISKRDLLSRDRNRVTYFWERVYRCGRFSSECLYPGNGRVIERTDDSAKPVSAHPATVTISADVVDEIKASLLQGLRIEIAAGFAASPVIEMPKPTGTPIRRKRNRKSSSDDIKPLTPPQLEALRLHGENNGNMTKVAELMGVTRQTAKQHYDAATKKLAATGTAIQKRKPTTRRLRPDHLGEGEV